MNTTEERRQKQREYQRRNETKSWDFVKITAYSKYEWNPERVRAYRRMANTNETQIEH
jgi:hypothetical protein